jgi:type IV pilus assembly protein PilA
LAKLFHKGQKGFTLIELLIVVAILGILAAVIIPNVATFMSTGKLNAARTEAENIKTAALAYYADNSEWPTDEGDLTIAGGGTVDYVSAAPIGTYTFDHSMVDGEEAGDGHITDATYGAFGWDEDKLTFTK